ncbi:MAG: hypothetical protein EOP45_06080 [Sphingobacteriaceae bacterium]|nr:MAG: hypothetical protein EOP45_06080 [Sphingobacteriaceae bacterium]
MKLFLSFIFICLYYPLETYSQIANASSPVNRYVILDIKQKYIHHIITEQTGNDYNKTSSTIIEIFNILKSKNTANKTSNSDTLLISISALPTLNSFINWKHITLDSIPKNQIISPTDLAKECSNNLNKHFNNKNIIDRSLITYDNIIPIVNKGKYFYLPNSYNLTSYFLIKPHAVHTIEQADVAIIDITSPIFSTSSLLKKAIQSTGNPHAQLWASVSTGNLLQGKIHNRYEFWSNIRPQSHGSLLYYGMDKFLYQPGIGIVSGKYEAYFSSRGTFIDYFLDIMYIDDKKTEYK